MKHSSMTSRSGSLVCPFCEVGELESTGRNARCNSCGRVASRLILETLRQLITLPESLGTHACESGHPRCVVCPTECSTVRLAAQRYYPRLTGRHATRPAEKLVSSLGIEYTAQGRRRR
jgi:hypothetical protein